MASQLAAGRHYRSLLGGLVVTAILFVLPNPAPAGPFDFFEGSIDARFENPILIGNTILPNGAPHQFFDNTATAKYAALKTAGDSAATFLWGAGAGVIPAGFNWFSIMNFFPNQNVSVASGETFSLGTLTYFNGSSSLDSLVFGVDLVLDFIPALGTSAVDTLRLPIKLETTFNATGTIADSDFVTVPFVNESFFVFEQFGATVSLDGAIIGDPFFDVRGQTLLNSATIIIGNEILNGPGKELEQYDPNDYLVINNLPPDIVPAFVGPTPEVPEPVSSVLFGLGIIGLAGWRWRRRN